ncbi:hypothetical protein EfmAA242_14390 [Enterococcus faecium]|nr:hypothetical protein EfmAA242_14390 [Enterococcus faecium]
MLSGAKIIRIKHQDMKDLEKKAKEAIESKKYKKINIVNHLKIVVKKIREDHHEKSIGDRMFRTNWFRVDHTATSRTRQ